MGKIIVKNIRVYAHHGCLGEETLIGSEYRVDITVSANLSEAISTDRLSQTVDYVHINRIVKAEMNIPSKLLEHVANRIIGRIFLEILMVEKIKVCVSKINPPIGGDVEMVSVKLSADRQETR